MCDIFKKAISKEQRTILWLPGAGEGWNGWSRSRDRCFPGGSDGKESACSAGDMGSIPGSGRPPEKGMATHSIILAWRIPWTEEPCGLYSPWGCKEPDTTEQLTQKQIKEYKFSVIRKISSEDTIHRVVTLVNSMVLYTWKLLGENLKPFATQKKS